MALIEIQQRIEPLLKWPGGKFDELQFINPAMPEIIQHYLEPFLGGGAVYFSIPLEIPACVNDKSSDLINFYRMVASQDVDFFLTLDCLTTHWRNLETILDTHAERLVQIYCSYREHQIDEQLLSREINDFVDNNLPEIQSDFEHYLNDDLAFYEKALRDSLKQKMTRMRKLEQKKGLMPQADILNNIEAAIKASFYYYIRYLYNYTKRLELSQSVQGAIFFFIRENAYGSMFRFNKQGHFNIPYGGISYNRKNIEAKIDNLKNPHLLSRMDNTEFVNADFADFMQDYTLNTDDFIFLDPPYDTEFSNYDRNPFVRSDQERLADFLINHCDANFMLVIKETEFIASLYENQNLNIRYFDKKYMYTVKERNNRDVVHMMFTNY